jgi:hypothetical protein
MILEEASGATVNDFNGAKCIREYISPAMKTYEAERR